MYLPEGQYGGSEWKAPLLPCSLGYVLFPLSILHHQFLPHHWTAIQTHKYTLQPNPQRIISWPHVLYHIPSHFLPPIKRKTYWIMNIFSLSLFPYSIFLFQLSPICLLSPLKLLLPSLSMISTLWTLSVNSLFSSLQNNCIIYHPNQEMFEIKSGHLTN